MVIRSLLI